MDETYALVDGGGHVWAFNPNMDAWVDLGRPDVPALFVWDLATADVSWRTFYDGFGSWEAVVSNHGLTA